MSRWIYSAIAIALLGSAAVADDAADSTSRTRAKSPPTAKQPTTQIIRVVVVHEEAQPAPAGPSSTPAATLPAAVAGAVVADPQAATACSDATATKRHLGTRRPKPDCPGCTSLRYEAWFGFSSCRSFFGEGPYAPRYPDCPSCTNCTRR